MAKRKKVITAGRLVSAVAYTTTYPRDSEHVRAGKLKISSKARCLINLKTSARKLKLKLAANFGVQDLVITLTYRDADLPPYRAAARTVLKKFLVQLRAARRARGKELYYIYVTEERHGEGRLHHHLVLNATGQDYDEIRSLWIWGDNIEFETIDLYGYAELASYLTKEPRAEGSANGARTWEGSRNLQSPETESGWMRDDETLTAPPGAVILDRREEQNEFGTYTYLEYLMPEIWPRRCRPPRKLKNASFSDLEQGITIERVGRKE